MGYGGKYVERARARELRAEAWTLMEIATELGVAKGTVSVWVREVEFTPKPRNRGHPAGPHHPMRLRKEAEITRCRAEADAWLGEMTHRELTMYCLGLYQGEGAKTPGGLSMANTNPVVLRTFVTWLRRAFDLDETRLRVRLYLHDGIDLQAATAHWSRVLDVPSEQFQKPYRAVADPTRRSSKHENGCATLIYSCSTIHRRVLAMIEAISCRFADPG
jgi:hypothetical protein